MSKYPGNIITSGANAGYSVAFDGTGDYLNAGSKSAYSFGTGDFTVEMWAYFTSVANFPTLTDSRATSASTAGFNLGLSTAKVQLYTTSQLLIGATTLSANVWYHIAVCRSGTTLRIFLNGVQDASTTNSTNWSDTTLLIGATPDFTNAMTGYISNVRLLKGTALYTAAFTPPTQLFNVPNTSLLTCNSPAIIDQSPNAFAITVNGNAAASTFTPFTGYTAYNPALGASTPGVWTVSEALEARQTRRWNMYDPYFNLTTLLLHGNGTNGAQNNTFLDSSSNNFTITRNGNTTQGTFSPFSQTGWSNYFGGSTDYLTAANNTALQLGSSDFTIEGWVYVSASSASLQTFLAKGTGAGNQASYAIQLNTSNQWTYYLSGNGSTWSIASGVVMGSVSLNAWNHVALVRSGSTFTPYVNGVAGTTTTSATALFAGTAVLSIGADDAGTAKLTGYVSNARVVKGTAVYTSNFTPPTSPLTAITNTQLLTCQSNRFVDNSSNAFAITVNGTPSVQAFSPFYPVVAYTPQAQGGSGYFDGTGDYLSIADNAAFDVGSGDFTFEAWVYTTAFDSQYNVIASHWPNSGTQSWIMRLTSTYIGFVANISGTQIYNFTTTVNLNEWMHVCFTRSGTTLTGYKNGVQVGTTQTITGTIGNGTGDVTVGVLSDLNNTTDHTGYISGLRIIKGTATAPTITSPPTNVTNTSLLLNFTNAGITDATAKNDLETVGNAQISTTQSKFGGSSMSFNGTNSYLKLPDNAIYSLSGGNYTIEFWLYLNSVTGIQVLVERFTAPSGPGYTLYMNGTAVELYGSAVVFSSGTLSTGQWYHIAVSRSGSTTYLFINGTQSTSTTNNIGDSAQPVYVGARTGTGSYLNGYIDDLRITKGFARYTANFTPQTSQWQDQ